MNPNRMHVVQIRRQPTPPSEPRSNWARWTCTCGRRSKLFAFVGYAERAGADHARVKGGVVA